jgi:predicted RNA binding protein YcfA (HicA-like mRNA interferase family)
MPKISPIPARKLMKVFEKAGFSCVRIEGDHYVYTKEGVIRPIVIPDWREIPVFIIKNNLRSANISREEYFTLLAEAN